MKISRGRLFLLPLILGFLLLGVSACNDSAVDLGGGKLGDGDIGESDANDGDIEGEGESDLANGEPTQLYLGYAEHDITPPLGTPLGGFGLPGGHRGISAINDPLYAQAALFTNDIGQAFLIISMDVAGYFYEFGGEGPGVRETRQAISEALSDTLDIAPEHVLIAASHSHSATDLVGFWQDYGKPVPRDLLDQTKNALVAAALEAAETLEPVALYHGQNELVGYTGRDNGCSDTLDNTVSILQAKSIGDEQIRLTLINYAKHPTLLPETNTEASADFIWGYREEMKQATGAPAMFLQGFVAAVHNGPLSGSIEGDTDAEIAYNQGKILAQTVLDATTERASLERLDIEHRHARYECEAAGAYLVEVYSLLDMPKRDIVERDGAYWLTEIEVSWHRIGPVEFAVFPGEGTPEYSLMLRERMVSPGKFIVGLGNDSIGYIIDPGSIEKDTSGQLEGYELKMGLGRPAGPATWEAMESLGWYRGAWQAE